VIADKGGERVKPTVHETLQLNELVRMEATEVRKLQAMLPMIADEDLRAEVATCIQNGTVALKALVDFCKTNQLAH
jgi:hypothetical protein